MVIASVLTEVFKDRDGMFLKLQVPLILYCAATSELIDFFLNSRLIFLLNDNSY